jgi:hypothetical protein
MTPGPAARDAEPRDAEGEVGPREHVSLGAEEPGEGGVHGRGGKRDLLGPGAVQPARERARDGHGGEERGVEVAHALHAKHLRHRGAEGVAGVPTAVVVEGVGRTPQHRERGHGREKDPSRREQVPRDLEGRALVVEVLEHVGHEHQRAARGGDVGDGVEAPREVGVAHVAAAQRVSGVDREGGAVEAQRVAVAPEHGEV